MKLLRILGFPLALVYGLVVRLRNHLYDSGIFKSQEFDTPTICVGNISLGGTGKSPMVEFLVAALSEEHKVAVLSRGYRRKSTGFVLANSESTVEELGDEPFQIHRKFENLILAVDTDRSNGIQLLKSKTNPDLIILDDAFQHRKVKPTFSVLLTAYDKLYSEDYFLPYGTLRDGRNQAKRADVIVVTKCPSDLSEDEQNLIIEKLRPTSRQKVLFSYLKYAETLKGLAGETGFESISEKSFTLVTGIANPRPFIDYLKEKRLQFEHLRFKDHHAFTRPEIADLNSKQFVLTTEKDFVRLQGKVEKLAYIEIRHQFFDSSKKELISEIEKIMKLNF